MFWRAFLLALFILMNCGILTAGNIPAIELNNGGTVENLEIPVNPDIQLRGENTQQFFSNDKSGQLEYVTSLLWAGMHDILVEDGYAYCALTYGLVILDVSDGFPFDTLSALYLPSRYGRTGAIEKNGDILYFSRYYDGVYLVDVSDVANPQILSQYPARFKVEHSFPKDNLLFMTESDSGLTILDVTDPSQPELLSIIRDIDRPQRVFAQGDIAVVAGRLALHILKIADPTHTERTASYIPPKPDGAYSNPVVQNVILKDNIAYVGLSTPDMFMHILDLSNPSNPKLLNSYKPSDVDHLSDIDMVLEDSLLFYGSDVIDVSDPMIPRLIHQYRPYACRGMDVYDEKIYVARHNWFLVYDLRGMKDSLNIYTYMGYHEWPGWTESVIGRDNDTLIFAAVNDAGPIEAEIFSINVNDPQNPIIIGRCENPIQDKCRALYIQGDYLYSGKYIFDVSDPSNMNIIGQFSGSFSVSSVADIFIHDNLAFLVIGALFGTGSYTDGLYVYDIADPQMPIYISRYDADINFLSNNNVVVRDTIAYLTTENGLHIINYADPATPLLISIYSDNPCASLDISDSLAYLLTNRNFDIIDISDPTFPVQLGFYEHYPYFGSPEGIAIGENYAYVATYHTNLRVIDISNPLDPFLAETYRTPSEVTYDIFARDGIIYLADHNGLMVLKAISKADYLCGDINADGTVNVTDAVNLMNYIFTDGHVPEPMERAELNCDNEISVSDIVYLINYIFTKGNGPCDTTGDGMPDC